MCRWFAYISPTEPCLLQDVLVTPKNSLSRQVHDHYLPGLIAHDPDDLNNADHLIKARNSLYNIDGLGVVWYTSSASDFERGNTGESSDGTQKEGLRPAVYKTTLSPLNDMNFRAMAPHIETNVCFAHIRASSATPVVQVNNHPFVFGRHVFMHNGVVSNFTAIKREVCKDISDAAFAEIQGGTDSEHMAALYMTFLTQDGPPDSFEHVYPVEKMARAMNKAVSIIIEAQKRILGDAARPNSLNLCATDGINLVAYRFRNHATQEPPSLYYSTKAGTTLNRKYRDTADGVDTPDRFTGMSAEEHGKHLIVASEPSTYKKSDWHLIGKNQCLMASDGLHFEILDVPYSKSWDSEDSS